MKSTTKSDTGRNLADRAVEFLTEVLGFASDRVNERVLSSITDLLQDRDATTEQCEAAIIAAVTVGETYFLRHPDQFDWIVDHWLPEWFRRMGALPSRPLRVLCAGCATGEEAYSTAALLQRAMPRGLADVEITGFDVNTQFLDQARRGEYRTWSLRGIELKEHRDWLELDGTTVHVRDPVAETVDFIEHNLLVPADSNPTLTETYDLILCRNVLLYFHRDAIRIAYNHLGELLGDHGVLVVGPSDPSPPDDIALACHRQHGVRHFRPADDDATTSSPSHRNDTPDALPSALGSPSHRNDTPDALPSALCRTESAPSPSPVDIDHDGDDSAPSPGSKSSSGGAPVDSSDICRIARNLARTTDTELAARFLDKHLRGHPVDVDAHVLGAQYALELGDLDRAFRWGRRAVYLAPDAPWVIYLLATICRRCGRHGTVGRYISWTRQLLDDRQPGQILRYSDGCTVRQLREVLDGIEQSTD